MSQSLLADALAAGASVVTPNNRLARDVAARFDAARRDEGKVAWHAPQSLPWALWVERLRLSALQSHAIPERALTDDGAARELWHAIIEADRRDLLNARGAARHAMDAWALFHAWRQPDESLRAIVARGRGDDPQAFAAWGQRYRERLDALGAIDRVQLQDMLAANAAGVVRDASPPVVLHGFLSMTPQQQRLVAALRAAGMPISEATPPTRAASCRVRTSAPSAALEIGRALGFARERVAADRGARVAVVVANLTERRDEIIALAEEILCPEQLLSLAPDAPRPYGVSLAEALASVPIVACALALIAVASGHVDAALASALVRAPFLPDAQARWTRRAAAERDWRSSGLREVGWPDIVVALRAADPVLHQRFSAAVPPSREARLPREWARAWSDWLDALGWPGTATLNSAQWQARDAWSNALARFAAAGPVTGPLRPAAALETLRILLDETLFQPEAPPAPVQILGSLEAVGLSFDSAWLAGFDAQRWPPATAPNPFLPIAWQHARGIPGAHPNSALAHAREMTRALGSIAGEIVVSHAETIDDAPAVISPLFADWPHADLTPLRAVRLAEASGAVALERIVDDHGPVLAAGTRVRGGAQLFDSQSACPFQAFGRFRLDAEPWAPCPDGLSASERGIVLHAMLTAFWNSVHDHATLAGLSPAELALRVDAAIEAGKAKLPAARWRALPPAIADAEAHRLASTLRAWIVDGELPRPPFVAQAHEQTFDVEVEGIGVRVRVDRIDALQSGGIAIIDYKSGRVVGPTRWFAPRPEGIQLAVYAQAVDGTPGAPIRALAYAKLKAGEIEVSGLADAADTWPALEVAGAASRIPVRDWADARAKLRDALAMLAREVREGNARVSPRRASTCAFCGLQPLCRIRLLDDHASAADASDG
jgi:probable DNA repair protein